MKVKSFVFACFFSVLAGCGSDSLLEQTDLTDSRANGEESSEDAQAEINESTVSLPTDRREAKRKRILELSKQWVGLDYLWGEAYFIKADKGWTGGADCSGYVGKVWELPSLLPFEKNLHPYSTAHFIKDASQWNLISREDVLPGDALVRRSATEGHIVIYVSKTSWNSTIVYEAKGKDYGIVHGAKRITDDYKPIRLHSLKK